MARIYGIDLGTTYSCVCYIDKMGMPQVVGDIQSAELLTPSVVMLEENDFDEELVVVGTHAKEYTKLDPERVISAVKRHMHDIDWKRDIDGREYMPADISAKILKHLADSASEKLGESVIDVVITVPAYFGPMERERTRQAGIDAGLNVRDIIPEPTAAALHYGLIEETGKTILVFDLGGGTFDVTVMKIEEDFHKRELAVRGDHDLGGVLWDRAIAESWAEQLAESTGVPVSEVLADKTVMASLALEAEKGKQRLGSMAQSRHVVSIDGVSHPLSIDRLTMDTLTLGLLERTISLVDEAIEIAQRGEKWTGIDKVILVGGSTLMKQVRERLEKRFGPDVELMINDPHFAVAYGAALYASQIDTKDELRDFVTLNAEKFGLNPSKIVDDDGEFNPSDLPEEVLEDFAEENQTTVTDLKAAFAGFTSVCPKSFGIVHVMDGASGQFVTNLIRTQQEMPAQGSKQFATIQAGQRAAVISCVENDRDLGINDEPVPFVESELIGTAEIELEPGLPDGSPIEITIEFTKTGLVRVHGRDLANGREATGEFKSRVSN